MPSRLVSSHYILLIRQSTYISVTCKPIVFRSNAGKQLCKSNHLTCRQSRAGSTSLDCFVSNARRKGKITRSASEPSRVCPASAKVAAAACPVLGLAGDVTGLGSTDLTSSSLGLSLGLNESPSDSLSWTTDLLPTLAR